MSSAPASSPSPTTGGGGSKLQRLVKELEDRVVASEEKVNELKDTIKGQGNSIADFNKGLKKNENGI
jgi:hypothetical protein